MIARSGFYGSIRTDFGNLKQTQVDGFEAILNEWEASGLADTRQLAYIIATAWHETAKTMQAIEEYGKGRKRKYGEVFAKTGKIYYGRGFVQLTWYYNYAKLGAVLGVDLYNHPELALDTGIAVKIMFEGMIHGIFTGRKLDQYFNDHTEDPINARRIINGLDQAELIKDYYNGFLTALA